VRHPAAPAPDPTRQGPGRSPAGPFPRLRTSRAKARRAVQQAVLDDDPAAFDTTFNTAIAAAISNFQDRWFVDETYVKVNALWRYVYRAIDKHGQLIDVLVSARRAAGLLARLG